MTDREMIEQMENDICNACKPRVAKCKCNFPCAMCGIVATELVKKYQPKIPDGAVMLTKEEYNDYINLKELLDKGYFTSDNRVAIHKARNEMAREILNELYVQFSADYLVGLRNEYKDWKYADLIRRYAKSVGVEIKE